MKVKIDDTVYLQKYDVRFLLHILGDVPPSVLHEITEEKQFFEPSPVDGLEFSYAFKKPESVEWLISQDAIVNFNSYNLLSDDEISYEIDWLEAKHYDVTYNVSETRPKYHQEKTTAEEWEIHKILSLKILQRYKLRLLQFALPGECQKRQSLIWRLFNRSAH